jgi:hypothetical protein
MLYTREQLRRRFIVKSIAGTMVAIVLGCLGLGCCRCSRNQTSDSIWMANSWA